MPRLLLQVSKTLGHFWKDYRVFSCIKTFTLAWGDVIKEYRNGIWKKTLKRFVPGFKGFAKDVKVAKINKAVAEMANMDECG